MRHFRLETTAFLLFLLLGMQGCSSPAPVSANIGATHGGSFLSLPGGKGYVEFLIDGVGPASTKDKKSQVIVYFVKDDGSPLEPAPSSVALNVEGGSEIPLKPAKDVSKTGRFESEVGVSLAAGREVTGELSASVGGETLKVRIVAR